MRELFGNARLSEELWFSGVLGDSFGVADDSLVADRELPAATLPAAGQYRAAIHCLHAGAEAVLFGTLTVIRLKRSLRHIGEIGPVLEALSTPAARRTDRALLPGQIITDTASIAESTGPKSIRSFVSYKMSLQEVAHAED